tara:strand:- start:7939 stop:9690 length:1752 start_codon:yes stop_codon:yes gene_type:complete
MRQIRKTIFRIFIFLFLAFLNTSQIQADLPKNQPEFLSPDEAFQMTYNFVNDKHISINWKIHPGYYLYMGMFEFESSDMNNKILKVQMPEGEKKTDEFFGQVDVYYISANADVFLEKEIPNSLDIKVKYQGCADAGLCYPPISKVINVKKKTSLNNIRRTSVFESQNAMTNYLSSNSLAYSSVIFYIAGLLLAFTPCVLPMVPILTGIIAGQGNVSQKRSLSLSVLYVLSMSITYSVAGIIVAISGTNIQASLQNPYVIGCISFLFFIFALAMFKFFDIQMPKSIQTLLTNLSNKCKSGRVIDIAFMGILSALIVGPCVTAPLIGALIYIASTGDVLVGGLALFALGLGMGTPLIILGSTTTKIISKIGRYLELVNYFFGILFLVVAVWLLERILSIQVAAYLWSVSSLVLTFLLIKATKILNGKTSKAVITAISISLLVYSGLQINGVKKNTHYDPITSFIEKKQNIEFVTVKTVRDLKNEINQAKQVVMVDLYADWCVACKELEKYTFSDSRVSNILNQMKLIKFDITKITDNHNMYLREMKIFGPPGLFFYDKGKEIENTRIVGFIEADGFLKVLEGIKK